MADTIDQLNFEVIIKDDQFKEKVDADLALAKDLNVQLSTLLDLQSKMPKMKIPSGASSDSTAAIKRAKDEEALARAISAKIIQDEKAKKAIADREAAESKAVAALGKLEEADNKVAKSASDAAAAAERAAKATTERVTAEVNAETALIKKGTAEKQALKEYVKLAEAEERKAEAAAKRQKAETDAAAAISKKATEEQRARKETAKAAEAEEKAAKAIADKEAAQSRAAKAASQAAKAQLQLEDAMERSNRAAESQSRLFGELKSMLMTYLSIQGASQLVQSLVRVTGEFELQRTSLGAMIRDLNTAETIVARIQALAVESPFQFKELTTYAKQLSAFSVPTNELLETTKMLADISAGLGVGMDRIVLAYGQVRSAAFLRGQEVRQFTEAGIPILDELAKKFTELKGTVVSTGEVFDLISKRMVPFEMVAEIFKDMTTEGGKFYNMQSVQADTLKGKISNLKDAYEVMLNEIGKGQSENLKNAVDWVRRLMMNYEELGKVIAQCVVTFGILRTAVITTAVSMGTLNAADTSVAKIFARLGSFAKNNPYTLIAAGLTAAGVGIYRWVTRLEESEKVLKSVTDTTKEYYKSLATEKSKLQSLYAQLELAREGTEEYEKAKSQIYTQFAPFISKLKEEGVEVSNLAAIYGNLVQQIEESQKAKFKVIAAQSLEEQFAASTDKLLRRTERKVNGLAQDLGKTWSEYEEQAFIAYVTGVISEEDIKNNENLTRVAETMALPIWQGVDNIREAFKEATEAYSDGIDAIDALYGQDSGSGPTTTPTIIPLEPGGESDEEKAIKANIRSIQDLQDAYRQLEKYMNETSLKKTLRSLFPNVREGFFDNLDFEGELRRLATELEVYDKEAAQSLRDSIGKQSAKEIADLFEAFMKYKEAVDDWRTEDFNFYGGDEVGKILRDLSKEYESIEEKRRDTLELLRKAEAGDAEAIALLREALGEEVWKKYVTEGKKAIEDLANAERDVAYKEAEDKAREKASEMLKRRMEEENIDLTDFADKSIAQVRALLDRLGKLKTDIEAEIANLEDGGLTEEEKVRLAELTEELELLGKQAADTGEELEKKIGGAMEKIASQTAKTLENLGKEISEFGKLLDAPILESLGGEFAEMSNMAGDFAQKVLSLSESLRGVEPGTAFKDLSESVKGGIFAVAATAVVAVFKQMKNAITSYIQQQDLLNEKLYEYRDLMLELRREDFSNIFGTDEMALAAENARILTEAQERYNATLDKMNQKKSMRGSLFVFGKDGEKIKSVMDMLEEISGNQGWNLYDQNGMIDVEALEIYYETFKKQLSRKQRKLVEELIENGKALDDAAAQQAQYLTDLFSGVADSIADSMVEAFIESGNAAIDMGEIMSDVAKTMVADLIKSMFIKDILDKYQADLEKITSDESKDLDQKTTEALGVLDTALAEIDANTPKIQEIIAKYLEYLGTGEDADEDKSLGAGIKGITEDTANLLASYLNAIRADVSYARAIWERMDVSMQQIAAALAGFSAPSLMEYQAKIESNTYNTMEATRSILSHLRSVIDYESSSPAIRVS